jgi:hypothetical protein
MDAWDPTGEKARAVKARYVGVCRGCGADTQPRNGKGDAYAYCKRCHPGPIERRWTRERVLDAMLEWQTRYGRPPSSYDWSRSHARRRGGEALERLARGEWPAPSVVTRVFGAWAAARAEVSRYDRAAATSRASAPMSRAVTRSHCLNLGNPPLIRGSERGCSRTVTRSFAALFHLRSGFRPLFGSVRSPVQIRAPRLLESPANAGLSAF